MTHRTKFESLVVKDTDSTNERLEWERIKFAPKLIA